MNKYTYNFTNRCPNNNELIFYKLEIETEEVVMVENLMNFIDSQDGYHEQIADKINKVFPGKQYMVAFHHGVLIETWRN